MALEIISIHAPPRGATVWLDEEPLDWPFQFTPLREGRRQPGGKRRNTHDFNSRPSARGDKSPGRTPGGSHISIHAPPRGATHPRETFPASRLFQFTPLREGRPFVAFRQRFPCKFQFTPLREGRPEMPDYWLRAPGYFNSRPSARGDPPHMPMAGKETYFNSRRSARGDRAYRRGWSISRYFNSRPSARGDLMARSKTKKISHFNSRPSARGDVRAASRGRGLCISIHAPPRGATGVSASRSSVSLRISIHAPPRGATARQNVGDCIRVFQFTPLREGRLSQKSITPVGDYFNSRPSARGDSGQRPPSLLNPHFNSRPSARGDAIKGGSAIMYKFQFTPLREGRLPARFSLRASCTYFNSRPSARGDFSR